MPKNFNPQFMKEKLKAGWTTQDFVNYYGVTKEEIFDFVETHSGSNPVYKSFRRDVLENARIARQRTKKKTSSQEAQDTPTSGEGEESSNDTSNSPVRVVDPITQKIEEIENEIKEQEKAKAVATAARTELQSKMSSAQNTIAQCSKKINAINAELGQSKSAFEEAKKQLKYEYDTKKKRLEADYTSKKDQLEKDAMAIKQNSTDAESQLKSYQVDFTKLDDTLATIESYLHECQQDIRDLKKITITVSKDYEILIDKPFTYEDHSEGFIIQLRKDPLTSRMLVYQIKLCGELLSILEALKNSGETYDFVFAPDDNKENENLKALFELVSESYL